MKIGAKTLLFIGVTIGIAIDAVFSKFLDVLAHFFQQVGPDIYMWIPNAEIFPPYALQIMTGLLTTMTGCASVVMFFRWVRKGSDEG